MAYGDAFAFIHAERATYGVARRCRCFGVTRAGYYAWRGRAERAHTVQDKGLLDQICPLFARHGGRYRSPRIHHDLQERGIRVSRRRVARLDPAVAAQRAGHACRVGCRAPPPPGRWPHLPQRPRLAEYLAQPFRRYLQARSIRQSASTAGSGDNAHRESFFHSRQAEVIRGCDFATDHEVRTERRSYIRYYNETRVHSARGYRSPIACERLAA